MTEQGHTIRSLCGRARLSYHPEWSVSQPWASYRDGTAGRHYFSPWSWLFDMRRNHGYRFDKAVMAEHGMTS